MKMEHSIVGNGHQTIILIHGFLGSTKQWSEFIGQGLDRFTYLLIDLPGHGSSASHVPYSIDELAIAIHQIVTTKQLKNVVVIGHSMGGYIAARMLSLFPDNFKKIILLNSSTQDDNAERKLQRNKSLDFIAKHGDLYKRMAINNLLSDDERQHFPQLKNLMYEIAEPIALPSIENALIAMRDRVSSTSNLKNNGNKIHFIYNHKDPIINKTLVEKEAEILNANFRKLGCGHMTLLTHPEEIFEEIISLSTE